jgi:hypothetical protein
MSSIAAADKDVPKRQYIAAAAFNNNLFTYSTSLNASYQTVGSLVVNAAATSGNCAAGTILRENGKKLMAGKNPNLTDPNSAKSYTYLVGVYCSVPPFLSGYIDPNSALFALFSTDKAPQDNDGSEVKDGITGRQDNGVPVYTSGNMTTTEGNITATVGNITATAGNIAAPAGYVSAHLDITAGRNLSAGSNLILTTGGLVITNKGTGAAAGSATAGKVALVDAGGGAAGVVVNTTAVTANSLIFLSYNDTSLSNPGSLNVSGRVAGTSFTIGSTNGSDRSDVAWFIVN